MVVLNPYESQASMRFNATVVLNGLSPKADTLIHTTASLNFVSKEFVVANGFYKDCKSTPKLDTRVASEQRISMAKVGCPLGFTIDGYEFTYLQFKVLPHFKSSDMIFGLPALKQLHVVIHPSLNTYTMGDLTINCNRETRKISCMIVYYDKMDQIIVKQARKRRNLVMLIFYLFTLLRTWHPLRVTLEISFINNSNNSSRSFRM